MVKQSTPLTEAEGNRAPDAPAHFADTQFALVLCAMDDLSIASASTPSSVAGSRGTTPSVSRGPTPFMSRGATPVPRGITPARSRGTTPFEPRNRTLGPIRTPSPPPRGRLATAAAAASSVISSGVSAMWRRSSDTAETPRPNLPVRMQPPTELPVVDESPVARGAWRPAASVAADAAETRRQETARRGIPGNRSNPFDEELDLALRKADEVLRECDDREAAGASEPPLQNEANDVCTFCQEQFTAGDDLVELVCDNNNGVKHCFHRDCLQGWGATFAAQGSTTYPCPICRHEHDISNLYTPAAVEQPRGFTARMGNVLNTAGNVWNRLRADLQGVEPESSEEHDADGDVDSEQSDDADGNVDSEQSYDAEVESAEPHPEPRVELHPEFLDLNGGVVHCKNCWNGYNCHLKGQPGHFTD